MWLLIKEQSETPIYTLIFQIKHYFICGVYILLQSKKTLWTSIPHFQYKGLKIQQHHNKRKQHYKITIKDTKVVATASKKQIALCSPEEELLPTLDSAQGFLICWWLGIHKPWRHSVKIIKIALEIGVSLLPEGFSSKDFIIWRQRVEQGRQGIQPLRSSQGETWLLN